MIEFTKGYKTSDGKLVATGAEAQLHELKLLLGNVPSAIVEHPEIVSHFVLENKEKFVDILTTTSSSKPKARSVNGGKKNRKVIAPSLLGASGTASSTSAPAQA